MALKLRSHVSSNGNGNGNGDSSIGQDCSHSYGKTIYRTCENLFTLMSDINLEEESLILLTMHTKYQHYKNRKKKPRRCWVHDIIRKRNKYRVFYHLYKELSLDNEKFLHYFRVTKEQFSKIIFFVGKDVTKRSRFREVIGPQERLAICLK